MTLPIPAPPNTILVSFTFCCSSSVIYKRFLSYLPIPLSFCNKDIYSFLFIINTKVYFYGMMKNSTAHDKTNADCSHRESPEKQSAFLPVFRFVYSISFISSASASARRSARFSQR